MKKLLFLIGLLLCIAPTANARMSVMTVGGGETLGSELISPLNSQ